MKHNPCLKREYLLAGELRHTHRKQLGICTRQCVMLVPKLIAMDKSSTFPTYILHLDIFSNCICVQCQAIALHTASSAPASPGTSPRVGRGEG